MACGGGGDGEADLSCPASPCGGDPIGDWTAVEACVEGDVVVAGCDQLEVRAFDATWSGTLSVAADGTFEIDQAIGGTAELVFPAACTDGIIRSCSDLNDTTRTCTGDVAAECACTQSLDEIVRDAGDWSIAGDQLTLGASTSGYCVSGDTLSVTLSSGDVTAELIMTR